MTDAIRARLDALSDQESAFATAGGLSLALILTRRANEGLPMRREDFVSKGGTQVSGLQPSMVQRILAEHGITRVLHRTAGRTNPGSLGLMNAYVTVLNGLHEDGSLTVHDMGILEEFWVGKVREHFARNPDESSLIRVRLPENGAASPSAILRGILAQADAMRRGTTGGVLDAAMRLLAVAAVTSEAVGDAHIAVVEDAGRPSFAPYDFRVSDTSFHVSSVPGEQVLERCRAERGRGRLPVVLTCQDGVVATRMMFRRANIQDGCEAFDLADWLATGLAREGRHSADGAAAALIRLIARYNDLVAATPALSAPRIEASALERPQGQLI